MRGGKRVCSNRGCSWPVSLTDDICEDCAVNGSPAERRKEEAAKARAALTHQGELQQGSVGEGAEDVARLVKAARAAAFAGYLDRPDCPHATAILKELGKASEAFAVRVPWEEEPEVDA